MYLLSIAFIVTAKEGKGKTKSRVYQQTASNIKEKITDGWLISIHLNFNFKSAAHTPQETK